MPHLPYLSATLEWPLILPSENEQRTLSKRFYGVFFESQKETIEKAGKILDKSRIRVEQQVLMSIPTQELNQTYR